MSRQRRTQAERREQTRKQLLDNALRLFGERGYSGTSLEDIASASQVTTRPIFHYFGNKRALFAAVNAEMEARILQTMHGDAPWDAFLELCQDPAFRQVVLVDAPNVLGRERWRNSPVTLSLREVLGAGGEPGIAAEMQLRMLMGALSEAALLVAESEDPAVARQVASDLGARLFPDLPD